MTPASQSTGAVEVSEGAAEMLRAKAVLPIHYNTFPPIKQDPHAFARELEKRTKAQAV